MIYVCDGKQSDFLVPEGASGNLVLISPPNLEGVTFPVCSNPSFVFEAGTIRFEIPPVKGTVLSLPTDCQAADEVAEIYQSSSDLTPSIDGEIQYVIDEIFHS